MEASQSGIKVGGTGDTILILVLLGGVGLILWKSGIFGTLKGATGLADTAIGGVNTALNDVLALPGNLVQGVEDLTQLPLAIAENSQGTITEDDIFNAAITGAPQPVAVATGASLTSRAANMIKSVYDMFNSSTPGGVNSSNWSSVAVAHQCVFDANGNITSHT
jgi:hypothetical protein